MRKSGMVENGLMRLLAALWLVTPSASFSAVVQGRGESVNASAHSDPSQRRPISDDVKRDDVWRAVMDLSTTHGGQISFQDMEETFGLKYGCVRETYTASEGVKSNDAGVRYIYAKLHCSNDMRVIYAGQESVRPGRDFTYDTQIVWGLRTTCLRADQALEFVKGAGWSAVLPVISSYPNRPSSSSNIPNFLEHRSGSMAGVTLSMAWVSYASPYLGANTPPAESCLEYVEFSKKMP